MNPFYTTDLASLGRALAVETRTVIPHADAAIRWSVKNDHMGVLHALLLDGRAKPDALDSDGLLCGCKHGRTAAVRLLLQDGRAKPEAKQGATLRWAAMNGFPDIVRMLLADGRIHGHFAFRKGILWACTNGHADVVSVMLTDTRAQSLDFSELILATINTDRQATMCVLLASPFVTAHGLRQPMRRAVEMGSLFVVQELLRHPNIQLPSSLFIACTSREVARVLVAAGCSKAGHAHASLSPVLAFV